MANEFIIKHGFHSKGNSAITGSLGISGSVDVKIPNGSAFTVEESDYISGESPRFDFKFTNGNPLLEITSRTTTGSLFLRQDYTGAGVKITSNGKISRTLSGVEYGFTLSSNLQPIDTSGLVSLGNFNRRWKDLYLFNGAKISFGTNSTQASGQKVNLVHTENTNTLQITGSSDVILDVKGSTLSKDLSISKTTGTGAPGTGTTHSIDVTVSDPGGGNKYYLDNVLTDSIVMNAGDAYKFIQSDSSNSGHPFRLSTGTDGSGTAPYEVGVTYGAGSPGNANAYTQISVTTSTTAPLYYYCTQHSGMGGSGQLTVDSGSLNPMAGSAKITGSLNVTGSTKIIGPTRITGSLYLGDTAAGSGLFIATHNGYEVKYQGTSETNILSDTAIHSLVANSTGHYFGVGSTSNPGFLIGQKASMLSSTNILFDVYDSTFIVGRGTTGTGISQITGSLYVTGSISASGDLISNRLLLGGGTFTSASLAAGGGGTTVIANPGGSPGTALSTITIGAQDFSVGSGGSGIFSNINGFQVTNNNLIISKSAAGALTSSLSVQGSGSSIFDVQGSAGQLFDVQDGLDGVLMSVNDISGIPILTVSSSGDVILAAGSNLLGTASVALNVPGATTAFPFTGNALITGELDITGSGNDIFKVRSTSGSLFSVDDGLDGILMSVNDISGLPLFEISSSGDIEIVEGNISGSSSTASFGHLIVNGTTISGGSGTTVIANPGSSGAGSLTTIGIGGLNYSVSGGGPSIDTGSLGNTVITGSLTASGSIVDFSSASSVLLPDTTIPLINPQVEYLTTTAITSSGDTVPLPNGLTFISSSTFEYLEVFINGLRLRYDIDFAPRSTSTVKYFTTLPIGTEVTYKSLRR